MNELVKKLTSGYHPVEASVRPERTPAGFKAAIDRQYVHVRFTDTRGGTELGFKIDQQLSDLSKADFTNLTGPVRVGGHLTLDYEPVRCIADIELSTLKGNGRLELVSNESADANTRKEMV